MSAHKGTSVAEATLSAAKLRLFFTEPELAKVLTVSRDTVRRMRREGNGPPYQKVRGRVLFRVEDVVAWLDNQPRYQSRGDEISREGGAA
jgi:excisionase family DNA binding protein